MILFTILLITLALLLIFVVCSVAIGGAAMIIIFSDVIVCIAIIAFIMRCMIKRKRK